MRFSNSTTITDYNKYVVKYRQIYTVDKDKTANDTIWSTAMQINSTKCMHKINCLIKSENSKDKEENDNTI